MTSEPVTVNKIVAESSMNYNNTSVLQYKIEYPQFFHPLYQKGLNGINGWYRILAEELQQKYETELYKDAVELYEYSKSNQFPFHMYEAVSTYEITYNLNDLLSLYYDHYIYSGGAHGGTERRSQTWNARYGCRILLFQYTDDPVEFREAIIDKIDEQIRLQIEKGDNMYFDDYSRLVSEYFDPDHYYFTPEGTVIFYQQYEIAPYASGIPEFTINL